MFAPALFTDTSRISEEVSGGNKGLKRYSQNMGKHDKYGGACNSTRPLFIQINKNKHLFCYVTKHWEVSMFL